MTVELIAERIALALDVTAPPDRARAVLTVLNDAGWALVPPGAPVPGPGCPRRDDPLVR
jgi:hypothetical protein